MIIELVDIWSTNGSFVLTVRRGAVGSRCLHLARNRGTMQKKIIGLEPRTPRCQFSETKEHHRLTERVENNVLIKNQLSKIIDGSITKTSIIQIIEQSNTSSLAMVSVTPVQK